MCECVNAIQTNILGMKWYHPKLELIRFGSDPELNHDHIMITQILCYICESNLYLDQYKSCMKLTTNLVLGT